MNIGTPDLFARPGVLLWHVFIIVNTIIEKSVKFIKSYPLSLTAVAAISFGAFVSPAVPTVAAKYDKLVHFAMYAAMCSTFWYEYYARHKQLPGMPLLPLAVILPVAFGSGLELLQGALTENRKCDVFDFFFNSFGVLYSFFFSFIIYNKEK